MSRCLAVLCVLGLALFVSSPALGLATSEEVLKMMADKWSQTRTMQADTASAMRTPAGPFISTGHIITARSDEDGKPVQKLFMTMKVSMKMSVPAGGQAVTNDVKIVSDGHVVWQEVRTSADPGVQVIKMKADGAHALAFTPEEQLKQLKSQYDFAGISEDTIDGRKMYVLEGKLQPDVVQAQPGTAKMASKVKYFVDQETLGFRRMMTYDADGRETTRSDLTNLKTDQPVDPKTFEYTPPEGARVQDMTDENVDE